MRLGPSLTDRSIPDEAVDFSFTDTRGSFKVPGLILRKLGLLVTLTCTHSGALSLPDFEELSTSTNKCRQGRFQGMVDAPFSLCLIFFDKQGHQEYVAAPFPAGSWRSSDEVYS